MVTDDIIMTQGMMDPSLQMTDLASSMRTRHNCKMTIKRNSNESRALLSGIWNELEEGDDWEKEDEGDRDEKS